MAEKMTDVLILAGTAQDNMAMAKKRHKNRQLPPICLALIICDAIWTDRSTGKRTILGTFSNIFSRSFPAQHPVLSVHCSLTDGHGETDILLKLVDVDEIDPPLLEQESKISFGDPRMICEMDAFFSGLTFPHPGEYRLQIFGAGTLLMERRILAVQLSHEEQENG